ncbi:OPT oligopeptide transporter protein [Planctomycetes bacterium Poly30]|uniref:OPT oligopeptide transporter protein n=1 Tax=Saltatorellus ferox TaxID=2528018 RepID=A0A518EPZ0_9BACT|nr:OPT oligopeptide transporter protein [Planctomycetes bacterium Poly30]
MPPQGGPAEVPHAPAAGSVYYGTSGPDSRVFPTLSPGAWITFAVLAAALASTNIYTTLLIGWGDTGSIVAVLAAFAVLKVISGQRTSVHTLNLGQTMASAGGSVGFAVANYAAVYIVDPTFRPPTWQLIILFIGMGWMGAIVGSSVRRSMVGYFFPSGTACAVIQTSVARELAPGERNRPVWLLTFWGLIASVLTIPSKITGSRGGHALVGDLNFKLGGHDMGVGIDPLYYGIGIVVGPRVGIGMLLGALVTPFLIVDGLAGGALEGETGDWVKWTAIAVLTIPTFATILFAYFYRQPAVVPSGFTPGVTHHATPKGRFPLFGLMFLAGAITVAILAKSVFHMPYHVSAIVAAVAWPMCVVNGRVTGDTDINPVRLVAIVLLSAFFWLISDDIGEYRVLAMLGMAVVGGTLASTAVDMMQDYRTGYLVDANPTHQTSVQFVGTAVGAIASIPILNLLLEQLGIGAESSLPAPGATIWAAMGETAAGGFSPSSELIWAIVLVSVIGSFYAFLTVWPKTAAWMPSLFGFGIGMLIGVPASAAIFLGGMIKWVVMRVYTAGKNDEERASRREDGDNDTMLAGASVFAAAALVSIALVLLTTLFESMGVDLFYLAGGH